MRPSNGCSHLFKRAHSRGQHQGPSRPRRPLNESLKCKISTRDLDGIAPDRLQHLQAVQIERGRHKRQSTRVRAFSHEAMRVSIQLEALKKFAQRLGVDMGGRRTRLCHQTIGPERL
jgi:hypothetical protein